MVIHMKNTQKNIEFHLQEKLKKSIGKDNTFKDIFGDVKKWIFEEGMFRFILNPISRRWLIWDYFHNEWKDTGYYAGEVEFILDGEKLITRRTNNLKIPLDFEPIAELVNINDSTQKYPILTNTLIGNERNCDIKIDETDINALILQHTGGFTFFALGKKDTTFVNNNIVPQEGILLDDGDKIMLGETKLIFKKISQPKQEILVKQFCPYCGAKIKENQKFCTSCGKKLQ